jgi:uncharacterized protein YegP (UPF0339 family)
MGGSPPSRDGTVPRKEHDVNFEVYDDKGGKPRWRLKAPNGQTTASSGEAFSSTANAKRAAENFKARAATATFDVHENTGGNYSWRATSSNGQTIATAGEAFSSKANAQRAADNVKAKAGAATGP